MLTRGLKHCGNFQPVAYIADGGEIVARAQACAGSMLAIFVSRETIVGIEAMLFGQVGGRRLIARAALGVRTVVVVRPEAMDDKAVA